DLENTEVRMLDKNAPLVGLGHFDVAELHEPNSVPGPNSWLYPIHRGVTEAGDGEDGRIKSAIGIGSLLMDGIGDTIRVSLTEDSVYEIPVAQAIAAKAMSLWTEGRDGPPGRPGDAARPAVAPYPASDSI